MAQLSAGITAATATGNPTLRKSSKAIVADQQDQLKKLQEQMQADAAAAAQTKQADSAAALVAQNEAHNKGLWQGVEIGAGGMLVLLIVIFGVRRFSRNFTISKKSQAASA